MKMVKEEQAIDSLNLLLWEAVGQELVSVQALIIPGRASNNTTPLTKEV
jgi:hypothetical protein